MSRNRRMFVLPAVLSAAMAAGAGAQQQQAPQCSIDEGKPTQLARALLMVESARGAQAAGKHPDAAKQLSAAVKALTESPEKLNNPNGRNLILGKALSLWLNQPDVSYTVQRGTLGYATDPQGTVDLIAAIDTAFAAVEKVEPGCAAATAPYRAQKPWVNLVNLSIEHLNADRADSAEVYAKRAMQLYPASPYGHMVLGNVAQRRNPDEAISHWREAVAASTDTLYNEAKRSILYNMGNLASDVADTATATATKQRYAGIANEAYETLVKEFPSSPQAAGARSGQARMRLAAGDTAGFRATYADQLSNPSKYSYQELLVPAVAAARAEQYSDAVKLFENVLTLNAYNRDALFNAALMYYQRNDFEKMLPLIGRLVQVDPSNDENWRLYAHAYSGLAKNLRGPSPATTTPARTASGSRAPARPAAPRLDAATEAKVRAYNDSTVKYFEMAEKMPHRVEFTEWTNQTEKSTVSGTIQNKGAAAKTFTLNLEFLDAAGAVVDTQTSTVADVAANAKGRFTATSTKPGVVAFRYKPIS
jgi:tetratricopeptide (TPR) repeat protein